MEAWLRGPLPGISPALMPAAHALVQAGEDLATAVEATSQVELWVRPGGAASLGFHLRHVAGSIRRLLTYAAGRALDDAQRAALEIEPVPGDPSPSIVDLVADARAAIDEAIAVMRHTSEASFLETRFVGRARAPSTVGGLLFHMAEHTQRHVGQVITTARIVRGLGLR